MAYSVTELAWGLLKFKDAYEDAGQLDYMYDSIRWPLDYLLKCHVDDNVLYGQVREHVLTFALEKCMNMPRGSSLTFGSLNIVSSLNMFSTTTYVHVFYTLP